MDTKKVLLVVSPDLKCEKELKDNTEYAVISVTNRYQALDGLQQFKPQVALVSLSCTLMPTEALINSQLLLKTLQEYAPELRVIAMIDANDNASALKCIALGVYDICFISEDIEVIKDKVTCAFNHVDYDTTIKKMFSYCVEEIPGITTVCENMSSVCRLIRKVAPTDVSTLLLGESGTGKELLARALHDLSVRSTAPFIAINCAAIPENLLESELFGYERGAFTGATRTVKGKIELAHGGTLFLDEIGDLPLSLQPKLLRFLQERTIERLGGRKSIAVDVRIVCATHKDLLESIDQSDFREDLFYRISEIITNIPPLRKRQEDILLLSHILLRKYVKKYRRPARRFSLQAKKILSQYHWPGNIRQLENIIKRAVILVDDNVIKAENLDIVIMDKPIKLDLREVRESAERQAIHQALIFNEGNLTKSAKMLGITRPTLYSMMQKLKINNSLIENIF